MYILHIELLCRQLNSHQMQKKMDLASLSQAALAGVLAAHTTLPVIGVPLKSAVLEGTDALLATVMMPSGIPVATVAIDGSKNAAYLAAEIIALSDESLAEKIAEDRKKQSEAVLKKDAGIQEKIKEL